MASQSEFGCDLFDERFDPCASVTIKASRHDQRRSVQFSFARENYLLLQLPLA